MKLLTLVRHAKSSWKFPDLADRDRPLNERGRRDAPEMGRRLAALGYRPDLIVSSPANRAHTTARTIAEAIGYPLEHIDVQDAMYMAAVDDVLEIARSTSDEITRLMLVGHNPTFTELVNHLSGLELDNLPTCGIAHLRFEAHAWSAFDSGTARAADIDFPKKAGEAFPG